MLVPEVIYYIDYPKEGRPAATATLWVTVKLCNYDARWYHNVVRRAPAYGSYHTLRMS